MEPLMGRIFGELHEYRLGEFPPPRKVIDKAKASQYLRCIPGLFELTKLTLLKVYMAMKGFPVDSFGAHPVSINLS